MLKLFICISIIFSVPAVTFDSWKTDSSPWWENRYWEIKVSQNSLNWLDLLLVLFCVLLAIYGEIDSIIWRAQLRRSRHEDIFALGLVDSLGRVVAWIPTKMRVLISFETTNFSLYVATGYNLYRDGGWRENDGVAKKLFHVKIS